MKRVTGLVLLLTMVLLLPWRVEGKGRRSGSRERRITEARTAVRQRQYKKAIRVLKEQLSLFPEDVAAEVELGKAYQFDGQDERAMALYRQVLKEEPGNRSAKLGLAQVLGYRADYSKSDQLYRELLAANPGDEAVSIGLVRNLINENRREDARQVLDEALAKSPNSLRLRAYQERLRSSATLPPEEGGATYRNRVRFGESFFSDSGSNRSIRSWQQFDYHISNAVSARLTTEERSLWKQESTGAMVFSGTGDLTYRVNKYFSLTGGGGAVRFNNGNNRALYEGEVELRPAPRLWITGGFSRVPINPTVRAASFNIVAEGWHGDLDWRPGQWRISANGARQHYSDGNRTDRQGAEVLRWIGGPNLAFAAGYRGTRLHYDIDPRHGYFSPDRYNSHLAETGVSFRHKNFRAEYLVRGGVESDPRGGYRPSYELALRNRFLLGHWDISGDYFYFDVAQSTGAYRAHTGRVVVAYRF